MTEGSATLSYAVRWPVLGKYMGQLALVMVALSSVPLIVSVIFGEFDITAGYLVVIAILTTIYTLSRALPDSETLQINEGLVITALAFLLTACLMIIPFSAAGMSPIDAFFEAVSGITTTGLSVLPDTGPYPRTLIFARAWLQWYGGLGIVILSIAMLMGHHLALRGLLEPSGNGGLSITTTRRYAQQILFVYLFLTTIGGILLWLMIGDGFNAVVFTLAAVSTGGFAPAAASLATLDAWSVKLAVLLVSLTGAVPLMIYFRLRQRHFRAVFRDPEVRGLAAVTLITCLALGISLTAYFPLRDAFTEGLLLGLSAQTTTGFTNVAVPDLGETAKSILILSMMIGGTTGSTAGGFKILRLLILLKLIEHLIRRTAMPGHAVSSARIGGNAIASGEIVRAFVLILGLIGVMAFSTLIFIAYGYPPLDALFEVVSATGTVGLSAGIARPDLEPFLKLVLCADMLLGRLEIIALLVVLYPGTWLGKRR